MSANFSADLAQGEAIRVYCVIGHVAVYTEVEGGGISQCHPTFLLTWHKVRQSGSTVL